MSETNATVSCLNRPLNAMTIYQETRADLLEAKTKQDKVEILMRFASAHGLFSDSPDLYNRTLGK